MIDHRTTSVEDAERFEMRDAVPQDPPTADEIYGDDAIYRKPSEVWEISPRKWPDDGDIPF